MSKLIGKISGNDWSVAPEGAKYVDMKWTYSDGDKLEWNYQKLWVKGENGYWCDDGEYTNYPNEDFSDTDRYISRERDLGGVEEVVKYSSLQELPIGWFVKHQNGNVSMWNGRTLCIVNPNNIQKDCWEKLTVQKFEGWSFPTSWYSITAYADRYEGEWIPVDNAKELRKKELQEQIDKLTRELEQL